MLCPPPEQAVMDSIPEKKQRLILLDELRGFAVCCMVFYHGFYSLASIFGLSIGRDLLYFFMPAEPWFAGLFILISGICCNFSHSNAVRGAKLLLVGLAVTLVTCLILPQERIIFGILHFLSLVAMELFPACIAAHAVITQRPSGVLGWRFSVAISAWIAGAILIGCVLAWIVYAFNKMGGDDK